MTSVNINAGIPKSHHPSPATSNQPCPSCSCHKQQPRTHHSKQPPLLLTLLAVLAFFSAFDSHQNRPFALFGVQAIQWSACGGDSNLLTVDDVIMTPDPPSHGGQMSVSVHASARTQDVDLAGAVMEARVYYHGFHVWTTSSNVCDAIAGGCSAPLQPGATAIIDSTQNLPRIAPTGPYRIQMLGSAKSSTRGTGSTARRYSRTGLFKGAQSSGRDTDGSSSSSSGSSSNNVSRASVTSQVVSRIVHEGLRTSMRRTGAAGAVGEGLASSTQRALDQQGYSSMSGGSSSGDSFLHGGTAGKQSRSASSEHSCLIGQLLSSLWEQLARLGRSVWSAWGADVQKDVADQPPLLCVNVDFNVVS